MSIGYRAVIGWTLIFCFVEVGCGGDDDSTGGTGGSSGHGGAGATGGSGGSGGHGGSAGSGGASGGTAGAGNAGGAGGSGGTTGGSGGTGGTSAGHGGTGGTAGHSGGTGGEGGSVGGAAGGGAAGEGGSAGAPQTSCDELIAQYNQELAKAKQCDPSASSAQCQTRVSNALGCQSACDTVVNAATMLNSISAQFSDQGCPPPVCTAIACTATKLGICSGTGSTGTCQDHS